MQLVNPLEQQNAVKRYILNLSARCALNMA